MMTLENPQLNIENLKSIQERIEQNNATKEDYENLQFFINQIGMPFDLIQILKEGSLRGFEDFIDYRKHKSKFDHSYFESRFLGTIKGIISVMMEYLEETSS